MAEKVWFLTGTSRGMGRIWADAILARGDRLAATARNPESLAALKQQYGERVLLLELDVTRPDHAERAVKAAHAHFGRLDVVVNNAGYSLVGTIEEAGDADVHALFETNVLGAHRVIRAALPLLRAQGHGHIVGISSTLGVVAFPVIGFYCASKWAFEAMHEALAQEVKPFGLRVTLVEPGAYATEFGSPQSLRFANGLPAYEQFRQHFAEGLRNIPSGDPTATPASLFRIVDSESPPLRAFLGAHNLPMASAAYEQRLAEWRAWDDNARAAQGR